MKSIVTSFRSRFPRFNGVEFQTEGGPTSSAARAEYERQFFARFAEIDCFYLIHVFGVNGDHGLSNPR
ncbi:hypothetical protein WN55_04809 [Dufourea novaeangliae]|uniref:Uncharacterized protein n=1 Tax=Dufourea novaeangliae TaxID=178035 RepID=A0A154PLG8_DUFNO|nr:hypothetical protein WN55_04809 [Dufourea novaeangliae]